MAKSKLNYAIMIAAIVLLNYLSVQIASFLNIPFFLDTWATMLGVMAGGLVVGIIGGILYNILMMTAWGAGAWVWAFSSIWIAIMTYILWKKGWIDISRPGKLVLAGLIIGLTDAVVVIIILFTAWGGVETYEGSLLTYDALMDATGNKVIAAMGEKFITEPVDRIVSLFIAAIVFSALPKKYILNRK